MTDFDAPAEKPSGHDHDGRTDGRHYCSGCDHYFPTVPDLLGHDCSEPRTAGSNDLDRGPNGGVAHV